MGWRKPSLLGSSEDLGWGCCPQFFGVCIEGRKEFSLGLGLGPTARRWDKNQTRRGHDGPENLWKHCPAPRKKEDTSPTEMGHLRT